MALGCYFSEKDDTDLLNVTQVVLISHDFIKYFLWQTAHLNNPNLDIALWSIIYKQSPNSYHPFNVSSPILKAH